MVGKPAGLAVVAVLVVAGWVIEGADALGQLVAAFSEFAGSLPSSSLHIK